MGPTRRVRSISSCNADEMEPGTFKDRLLMEGDPHQLVEGMILARLRDRGRRRLHLPAVGLYAGGRRGCSEPSRKPRGAAISARTFSGPVKPRAPPARQRRPLHLRRRDGLLNALEGKRANPARSRRFPLSRALGQTDRGQ